MRNSLPTPNSRFRTNRPKHAREHIGINPPTEDFTESRRFKRFCRNLARFIKERKKVKIGEIWAEFDGIKRCWFGVALETLRINDQIRFIEHPQFIEYEWGKGQGIRPDKKQAKTDWVKKTPIERR